MVEKEIPKIIPHLRETIVEVPHLEEKRSDLAADNHSTVLHHALPSAYPQAGTNLVGSSLSSSNPGTLENGGYVFGVKGPSLDKFKAPKNVLDRLRQS